MDTQIVDAKQDKVRRVENFVKCKDLLGCIGKVKHNLAGAKSIYQATGANGRSYVMSVVKGEVHELAVTTPPTRIGSGRGRPAKGITFIYNSDEILPYLESIVTVDFVYDGLTQSA
jgi:hypothetical protein